MKDKIEKKFAINFKEIYTYKTDKTSGRATYLWKPFFFSDKLRSCRIYKLFAFQIVECNII